MIDISFEINGKKVTLNNMADELERAVINSVTDSIKNSVGSIRCSEHGESPKIKVTGRNLDNLSMEVSGCCDALIEKVSVKLK